MPLRDEQIELYSRQIILTQLGGIGQRRFLAARCLVRGGGPAFASVVTYLTGSGIGRLDLATADPTEVLAFAPPQERNPDVAPRRSNEPDEHAAYDIVIATDFEGRRCDLPGPGPGQARLGEIAVEGDATVTRVLAMPASAGCLDCLAPRSHASQSAGTTELALAGTMAAAVALRWLMANAQPDPTPLLLELHDGAPTWTSASLQQAPTCPRPCRPGSAKLTS